MTNGSILLIEDSSLFSPISQLNYEFYASRMSCCRSLYNNQDIQCIVEKDHIPFGKAQSPGLFDYADRVDTLEFLQSLLKLSFYILLIVIKFVRHEVRKS